MMQARFLQNISRQSARHLSSNAKRNVVVVDGVRIPFTMGGTDYSDLLAVDLGRLVLKGLVVKTAIDPSMVDHIHFGTGKCILFVLYERVCMSLSIYITVIETKCIFISLSHK
jgi:hypothetical protein